MQFHTFSTYVMTKHAFMAIPNILKSCSFWRTGGEFIKIGSFLFVQSV